MSATATDIKPTRPRVISPLPLSSKQEDEVKKIYTKNVRAYCADEIRAFAECAKENFVSVNWTCRDQKLAMNFCLRSHGTLDEQDRAREEWHATVVQKKKEASEKEEARLAKIYAERQRIDELEVKQNERYPPKKSWW